MPVNLNVLEQFHAVKGIEIATANAGIKQTERPDIVVFKLSEHTRTAGIFTQNAFCAAPVTICKQHLQQTQARMLLINTGNANAGTGQSGFDNAMELCHALAEANGVAVNEVLPFSTGVIGEPLPMQKILPIVKSNLNFSESIWFDASRGIMTTDIQPKGFSKQVEIQGETVTVSGISKGSGMIKPNMATMLGFIATDAPVSQALLEALCMELGDQSFNRITVDGDTSTNDSCMLMATCEAKIKPIESEKSEGYSELKSLLLEAFQFLAQAIVRDGEGATKFVTIQVEAAKTQQEALDVAYTVAHSPLVKTALFASDANWGRILAAVGRAGIDDLDLHHIEIYLDAVCIVEKGGRAASYTEEAGSAVMAKDEILIRIHLGRGKDAETVWTTDLSHGYVSINADYRS